jgi:hypothetical protein
MKVHWLRRTAIAALRILSRVHIFNFILILIGAVTGQAAGAGPHRGPFWIYALIWLFVFGVEWVVIELMRRNRGIDLEEARPEDVEAQAPWEVSALRLAVPAGAMLLFAFAAGRLADAQVLVPSWLGVKVLESWLRPRRVRVQVRRAASVGRLEMAATPFDPPHVSVAWMRPNVLREFEEAVERFDAAAAAQLLAMPGMLPPALARDAARAFIQRAHPAPPPILD